MLFVGKFDKPSICFCKQPLPFMNIRSSADLHINAEVRVNNKVTCPIEPKNLHMVLYRKQFDNTCTRIDSIISKNGKIIIIKKNTELFPNFPLKLIASFH